VSAFGYGVSDFVGGMASRRVAALRVVLVSYPVAMTLLTVLSLIIGGHISAPAVMWGSLCGIGQAFGIWWFYAALGAGPISVVSPLTSLLVSGVPVGVGLALGERPAVIAVVGIVLAFVAVVLVSRGAGDEDTGPLSKAHRFTAKVAWLTIGSGLAFGMNFVLIAQAPVDARLWPLVFARASASTLMVIIALFTRNLAAPTGTPLRLALFAGVLDTIANVAMLLAVQSSLLSLAAVLMSLYPVATVALAMVVLKERVTRWQAVGIVLALLAVGMIATG
jgi:drug/metabolite transporter (DMT)-like permease